MNSSVLAVGKPLGASEPIGVSSHRFDRFVGSQLDEWTQVTGSEAVVWFRAAYLEAAGTIFANALTAVVQAFGRRRQRSAYLPWHPLDARLRKTSFCRYSGTSARKQDWDRLVAAHRILSEMEAYRPDLVEARTWGERLPSSSCCSAVRNFFPIQRKM